MILLLTVIWKSYLPNFGTVSAEARAYYTERLNELVYRNKKHNSIYVALRKGETRRLEVNSKGYHYM